jgi:hypothetical protein
VSPLDWRLKRDPGLGRSVLPATILASIREFKAFKLSNLHLLNRDGYPWAGTFSFHRPVLTGAELRWYSSERLGVCVGTENSQEDPSNLIRVIPA